jgi:hypothetical protein
VKKILERTDLYNAQLHFARAAKASKEHSRLAEAAIRDYGDGSGQPISGCVRDHFPECVKVLLMNMAREVTRQNEMGQALRPRGVRKRTMDDLARAVCKRDGTGFYGYRV